MRVSVYRILSVLLLCLFVVASSGVHAAWIYFDPPEEKSGSVVIGVSEFNYDPGDILHISAMEFYSSSGFPSDLGYSYSLPTNVRVSGAVTRSGSSVTYKVTVFNDTDVTYWYIGPQVPNYGTNALLNSNAVTIITKEKPTDTSNTFNTRDWIPPRTERDFYVTYNFANGAVVSNLDLLVNYYFSIRIDGVQDEFLKILNDSISANGYHYLAGEFDDKYADTGSDVISNVGEKEVFDRLFGGDLMVDVDGVQTPATVVVQRKNVDGKTSGDSYAVNGGPTSCEYTVYVTTDPLLAGGKAVVYAVSYTRDPYGVWHKIGQLYEGTANVVNTVDGPVMDVNSWLATPNTYEIYDGISYKVAQKNGTSYDLLKTITQIMSTDDQEIFNKIDNSRLFKKVYDILNSAENKNSTAPEVVNLRRAFENAAPYYVIYNNGQEIKVVRKGGRSEILPYLVELSSALEYYNEVHN